MHQSTRPTSPITAFIKSGDKKPEALGEWGQEGHLIRPSSLSLLSVWVAGSEPEKSTTNWRRTGVCACMCGSTLTLGFNEALPSPTLSLPSWRWLTSAARPRLPRRAHLKECFETLKRNIPNVDDKKTSNLSVLRTALRYIQVWGREARQRGGGRQLPAAAQRQLPSHSCCSPPLAAAPPLPCSLSGCPACLHAGAEHMVG